MKRRLLALLLDWCLIVAWLAALGCAAAVAYLAGTDLSGDSAGPVELVAFLASMMDQRTSGRRIATQECPIACLSTIAEKNNVVHPS